MRRTLFLLALGVVIGMIAWLSPKHMWVHESEPHSAEQPSIETPASFDESPAAVETTPFAHAGESSVLVVDAAGVGLKATLVSRRGSRTCDDAGRCVLPDAWEEFVVTHAGHVPVRIRTGGAARESRVMRVTLESAVTLRGRVVDAAGEAVANARVQAVLGACGARNAGSVAGLPYSDHAFDEQGALAAYLLEVRSDETGRFDLQGMIPRAHIITVAKRGLVPGTPEGNRVVTPDGHEITLAMRRVFVGGIRAARSYVASDPDLWKRLAMEFQAPPGLTRYVEWRYGALDPIKSPETSRPSSGLTLLRVAFIEKEGGGAARSFSVRVSWLFGPSSEVQVDLFPLSEWKESLATAIAGPPAYSVGRLMIRSALPVLAKPAGAKDLRARLFPGYTPTAVREDLQEFVLPVGEYQVVYRSGRYLPRRGACARVSVSADEPRTIDLRKRDPGCIEVHVLDRAGRPTHRFRLRVTRGLSPRLIPGRPVVRIPVTPGEYRLELMDRAGRPHGESSVTVEPGASATRVELRMR